MAAPSPDKAPKPSLAYEAEYWKKARTIFVDFLKREDLSQARIEEITQDYSTIDQVTSSIESSKKIGDDTYGKIASAVIGKMNILISMGDFAIKGGPESIGLVWTAFKFIFGRIKDDYDACHMLADACASVVSILILCRAYGGMFFASMDASKDLTGSVSKIQECVVNAYLGILKFSYIAQRYFSGKGVVRVLKGALTSPVAKIKLKVDEIAKVQEELARWARVAVDKRNDERQEKMLENDKELLDIALKQHDESVNFREKFQSGFAQMIEQLSRVGEAVESKLTSKPPSQLAEEECLKNLKALQKMFPRSDQAWGRSSDYNPHNDPKYVPIYDTNTCQWIFELADYKSWASRPRSILWLYGGMGVGKSILMESIRDELHSRFANDDRVLVQHLVCRFGENDARKACRIMTEMIVSLYQKIMDINELEALKNANELFNRCRGPKDSVKAPKRGTSEKNSSFSHARETSEGNKSGESSLLTLDQLCDMYEGLTSMGEYRILLLIDGLEQCDESGQDGIAARLSLIADNNKASVNILVSSRPEPGDFDAVLGKNKIPILMVKDHTGEDIRTVIRQKLNKFSDWTPLERNMACEQVYNAASGFFRYIPQAIAFLEQPFERPLENRLKLLKDLPNGLHGFYQDEFTRVDPAYLKLLKTALTWASLSAEYVTVDEVMDAFSGIFTNGFIGKVEDIPTRIEKTQLERAGGLFLAFKKIKDQAADGMDDIPTSEESFLRPYYSVLIREREIADYFLREGSSDIDGLKNSGEESSEPEKKLNPLDDWYIDKLEGHFSIAKTCLLHLNSPIFQEKFLLGPLEPESEKRGDNGEKNEDDEKTTDWGEKTTGSEEKTTGPGEKMTSSGEKMADSDEMKTNSEEKTIDSGDNKKEISNQSDDEAFELQSENSEEWYDIVEEVRSYYTKADQIADEPADKRMRYELHNWHFHLRKAEELLKSNHNEKMEELWDLVEKFFCNEPAINAWKSKNKFARDTSFLQVACSLGLTSLVNRLLNDGTDPNELDSDGDPALSFVQADVRPELIKLLLQHGADPNFVSEKPGLGTIPPLHNITYLNPETEVIRLLLEESETTNQQFTPDRYGRNALHYFAGNGSGVEKLELFMKYEGADINLAANDGNTPLHFLLMRPKTDVELLKAFLARGANATSDNKLSQQVLCYVCGWGDIEAVNCLLDCNVDIYDDDIQQQTALHHAARYGHLAVIKKLYETADDKRRLLSKEDKFGRTPFYLACGHENLEVSEFLLCSMIEKKVENINKRGNSGKTPLRKAAFQGHTKIVEMLLELPGVRETVNDHRDSLLQTALHAAAYRGHGDTIALLLKAGTDSTLKDSSQRTALQKCYQSWARYASDELERALSLLVDHDPEVAAKDQELFSLAAMRGSKLIVKKLIDLDADPTGVDELGWTSLQMAQQFGNVEVLEMLKEKVAEMTNKPWLWILPPKCDSFAKISDNGLSLQHLKDEDAKRPFMSVANCPIPVGLDRYYYEISISTETFKSKVAVGVGLCSKPVSSSRLPGWWWQEPGGFTCAFHGDDSKLYGSPSMNGQPYAGNLGFGHGHTIGCGWNVQEETVFFTKNGVQLDVAFHGVKGRLFPAVGIMERAVVKTNFGTDILKNPFMWTPANDRSSKW